MMHDVGVAFLAAVLALVGWAIQEKVARSRRVKTIKAALAVEIASLVALIQHQHYASVIRKHAVALRTKAPKFGYSIVCIPITHSYFSVFEANANAVGEMEPTEVVHVIAFYQQARSLADSMSKEGTPDPSITPVDEAASRYETLADAIDKLCDLGLTVARDLASKEVLHQMADVAKQLLPSK